VVDGVPVAGVVVVVVEVVLGTTGAEVAIFTRTVFASLILQSLPLHKNTR
jgi:hypothetical protein